MDTLETMGKVGETKKTHLFIPWYSPIYYLKGLMSWAWILHRIYRTVNITWNSYIMICTCRRNFHVYMSLKKMHIKLEKAMTNMVGSFCVKWNFVFIYIVYFIFCNALSICSYVYHPLWTTRYCTNKLDRGVFIDQFCFQRYFSNMVYFCLKFYEMFT